MPRVRRGVRGPLLLRAPGTGGLSRGAGDDMLALVVVPTGWSRGAYGLGGGNPEFAGAARMLT